MWLCPAKGTGAAATPFTPGHLALEQRRRGRRDIVRPDLPVFSAYKMRRMHRRSQPQCLLSATFHDLTRHGLNAVLLVELP
jgi:hypothetical protein